ncbi:MAG: hypothetical protein HYX41_02905 [Bdellovibrio sp.]|nr:hypothetical protein [Bdellovibrio sp.]
MKIVSIHAVREAQVIKKGNPDYQNRILMMSKLELLTEMMVFQEERARIGKLTVPMMIRGRILFRALENGAETRELRLLARSYNQYLERELQTRANAKVHPAQILANNLEDYFREPLPAR